MYKFGVDAQQTLEQLSRTGAFFTVKDGDKINTMTIGWGSISQYWGDEVFIAPIRFSRYSHELLENTDEFTISIPANESFDEALKKCGTISGRSTDKFAEAGLKTKSAESISTPVIDGCGIFYECKIVCRIPLEKQALNKDIQDKWYANDDMHELIFGKIISCHR